MSEASSKGHTVGALIVLLVISALCAWGFSLMNDGDMGSGAGAGVLLFLFGVYVILALGPGDEDA
jgi:hypothetical protein